MTQSAASARPALADGETLKGFYPQGTEWDIDLRRENLAHLVDEAVQKYGDRPCLEFLGKKYTYKEFGKMVDKAAQGLIDMGVKKGDKIGLYMPNTPYYPVMFFAALKVGATVVNFSPLYVEDELQTQIRDSGTKIMVTLDLKDFYDKARSLQKKGELDKIVKCKMEDVLPFFKSWAFWALKSGDRTKDKAGVKDGVHDFRGLTANRPHFGATTVDAENDVAVLQYTGGTTGVPKGAMLTHFNLLSNAAQVEAFFGYTKDKDKQGIYMMPGKEKVLAVLPYFHVFGMMVGMISALKMGAEVILLPNPRDVKEVVSTIHNKKPTILPSVPRLLQAISEFKGLEKYDLSSIKAAVAGGAALAPGVQKSFEKAVGKQGLIKQGYGLTETSPVATSNPASGKNKPESVGMAYPATRVRIAHPDDASQTMKIGEVGEIMIAGPQVMKGYYNKPDATKEVMSGEWFHTGDLGYMDDDMYVHIVDRKKRLIIINGFNVYPNQVENAISKHDNIAECVVISVKDERSGEAAKAFVRLKEGKTMSEQDLRDFLTQHISRIEMPKHIAFVTEELPKTTVGKPDWRKLQDQEKAAAAPKPAAPQTPKP